LAIIHVNVPREFVGASDTLLILGGCAVVCMDVWVLFGKRIRCWAPVALLPCFFSEIAARLQTTWECLIGLVMQYTKKILLLLGGVTPIGIRVLLMDFSVLGWWERWQIPVGLLILGITRITSGDFIFLIQASMWCLSL